MFPEIFDYETNYYWGELVVRLVPMFGFKKYKAQENELLWVYDTNNPDSGYHVPARNLSTYKYWTHREFFILPSADLLWQSQRCPPNPHKVPKSCIVFKSSGIAPMFEELWSEIADAPGEIFDVIEYKEEWEKEEKFNVENYINSNYDYWWQL